VSGEPTRPTGNVVASDDGLKAAAESFGAGAGCSLHTAMSRPVEREEGMDWTRQGVPIDPAQAEAWRQAGWSARRWSDPADAEVLAEWIAGEDHDERSPAIVRSGALTGCSFGLFAFLGQARTCQPSNGSEYMSWPRCFGLDAMLLALIDEMYLRARAPRPRMLPWPMDASWVLNIRHDIDRTMTTRSARELLGLHQKAGTSATFYGRASHIARHPKARGPLARLSGGLRRSSDEEKASEAGAALRTLAANPTHEVAHHTERIWEAGAEEEKILRRVIGRDVLGTSAHGDPNCFRWQGAPNLLWAESRGHLFTEFISHSHFHPHRPAVLSASGEIRFLNVVCLPHHASFDASMKPGDTLADSVRAAAEQAVATRGMLQVMNHPDLNRTELEQLLGDLPTDGRLDWTAGQTADWWTRSHVRDNVTIGPKGDGSLQVRSERPLFGAILEVVDPGGIPSLVSLALESGRPTAFKPGAAGPARAEPNHAL